MVDLGRGGQASKGSFAMAQVVWIKKANKKRIAFLAYGEKEFGVKAALKMNNRIMDYVRRLADNPGMGAVEPLLQGRKKPYRSLVVHKLIKLVYYVDESRQTVFIADLWDTRREPARLARPLG